MTSILVVDDGRTDLELVKALLEESLACEIRTASNGVEALERIAEATPSLLITDLQMPEMNGLELVRKVRERKETLPVVLMTAHGSESIAADALRAGASGYVPKRMLGRDLVEVVERLLALSRTADDRGIVNRHLGRVDLRFTLPNDTEVACAITRSLIGQMQAFEMGDETDRFRLGVAIDEALANAIHHGNLEVSSELRDTSGRAYLDAIRSRQDEAPYKDRQVEVHARLSPGLVEVTVRDEGPGFDPAALPDPMAEENLTRSHGRGLMLIHSFMDEVAFNEVGNEIRFRCRLERQEASSDESKQG